MRSIITYLIYLAVLARAVGWNLESSAIPNPVWIMLIAYGLLLFSERLLTRRISTYPRFYILAQSALVIAMLYGGPMLDFIAMLFYPLSFQAVQFFPLRVGFACIGGYILAMAGMLLLGMEADPGISMVLSSGAVCILMGSFARLMQRTEVQRQENQRLFTGLQEAYRRLKDSAAQAEALAAAEERHRLVRELHNSLTQTLFSMNLAVQAAQLSFQEAPITADEHLTRLQALSRSAAAEVQALTGQIAPTAQIGLEAALRQLAMERSSQDGLQVIVEAAGMRELPDEVSAALYRITQEALNNVSRHAGVPHAVVRFYPEQSPAFLEVADAGRGFDLESQSHSQGFGLTGMAERAKEIGWELIIVSQPGRGTTIRVEEKPI